MHKHFSFSDKLTGSLSNDPGFVRPDIGRFLLLFGCSLRMYAREELEFLSFGYGILISLVFLLFSDSRYISDSVFI